MKENVLYLCLVKSITNTIVFLFAKRWLKGGVVSQYLLLTMDSVKNSCSYQVINLPEKSNAKLSWQNFLRQMMVVTTIWTVYFLYGLQIGAPTVLIPQLKEEANSTTVINDELASWIASITSVGSMPWALILPIMIQKIGRKKTFIFVSLNAFLGNIIIYFSNNVTQLLVGGFIFGITLASHSTVTPLIITEYSSKKYRGIFLTVKSASAYWGMWVANIIGTFWHWKNIYILALFCNVYTILCFIWPESPSWLAKEKRFEECTLSHRKLKGKSSETENELNRLINTYKSYNRVGDEHKFGSVNLVETIRSKSFYKPILLILILGLQYHAMGKFICSVYAIQILQKITGNKSAAYYGMLILDGVSVVSAYCGCIMSRYCKRRTLLFSTSTIAISVLFCLSLYLFLVKSSVIIESNFVSISLLAIFSVTACSGPMILVSSLYGEIVQVKYQLVSTIIYGCFVTTLMTVSLKASLFIFKSLTLPGTFLFFAVMSSFCTVILYLYLPETKNKTIQEINNYFDPVSSSQLNLN